MVILGWYAHMGGRLSELRTVNILTSNALFFVIGGWGLAGLGKNRIMVEAYRT